MRSRTLVYVEDAHPDQILRALGQRIRELRTQHGYSQEAFADKCGVHRTFMGTIERGESNLSFQNIAKVAATLDVTLSALFLDLESKAALLTSKSASTGPKSESLAKPASPKRTIKL